MMNRSCSAGAGDMLDALVIVFPIQDEHSVMMFNNHLVAVLVYREKYMGTVV